MNNKKIAGIVCEYNPFHTGHLYQIEKVREMGYEKIVCVMSGNTVQRGELAIMNKYSRAKVAIECGADLVLELPYPYSSSGAEFFAAAAVKILASAGVGAICFGSESNDIERLQRAAQICESQEFAEEYKSVAASDMGTAEAYFEAYQRAAVRLFGECSRGEFGSNDILGVSYIRAILRGGYDIVPVAIKREGSAYNDYDIEKSNGYPSALMIRNSLGVADEKLRKMMPRASYDTLFENISKGVAPCDIKNIEKAVLGFFRLADPSDFSKRNIAESGGGLCERICKCSGDATSYDALVEMVSGKKYTNARVRRAILAAMTGATDQDIRETPAYSTVLAFNDKGREILAAVRKRGDILVPFVTKPADAKALSDPAERQFALSERADGLFTLARPILGTSGEYVATAPIYIK